MKKVFKLAITKSQKGFTLVEVVIAIMLLGLMTAAIFTGLSTASVAVFRNDMRQTAQNVAESELELVKNQPFVVGATTYNLPSIPNSPSGYTVTISAQDWTQNDNVDYDAVATLNRTNIQKITVQIFFKNGTIPIYTLVGYKVE